MSRIITAALCSLVVFAFSSSDAFAANAAAGKATYDASCVTCHKTGLMGAPKLGDKAAWAPRIKQGEAVLVSHSIKGFQGKVGMMPPKGGNAKLTDIQVGNAVAYMVSGSK
ncbi:MAG: cytochrome c5 family protein [Chlorobiaceae bacterium]|nr:cytochrome c5 family protein [Chlorobiaceae bacterium]